MNNIICYKNMIYIIGRMYRNKLVQEYELESGDVINFSNIVIVLIDG